MAEEERIPPSAEAAASTADDANPGPSAPTDAKADANSDKPKADAAAAAAATPTDISKQQNQQVGEQSSASTSQGNNNHGSRTNTSHTGGRHNQRRRNKNKSSNYSASYNGSNNYNAGANYGPNPDRPGAYVPVRRQSDRQARRAALVASLTTQLEYYFSPVNLSSDTYLRTLMDLNSGYVPASVVASFGNVQRIVVQWDGVAADGSPGGSGGIVEAEPAGVQSLIREAAELSGLLDVVWIDGSGKKIPVGGTGIGGAGAGAVAGTSGKSGEGYADAGSDDKNGGGVDNGAATAATGGISNRVAIGPKNAAAAAAAAAVSGGGVMTAAAVRTGGSVSVVPTLAAPHGQQLPQKQTAATIEPGQSVVILRDAPAATTADDIRSVFTSAEAAVTTIHSDVGNTWFVTLDGSKTNRDDVISLLLSLRGMKLHGEPIKARLKAESVAARRPFVGPGGGAYGYAASAPQSPVAGSYRSSGGGQHQQQQPGQQHQPQGGGGGGGGIRMAGQRGNGPGSSWDKQGVGCGASRPSQHVRQSRSVPSSPAGHSHLVSGGKAEGKGGKKVFSLNVADGKPRGGGKDGGDGRGDSIVGKKSTGNKSDNADAISKGGTSRGKASSSAEVPPPPLVDLHFPALSGEEGGEKKHAAQLQRRPKEIVAEIKTTSRESGSGEGNGAAPENSNESVSVPTPSSPPTKKEADASTSTAATSNVPAKKPMSGYAAALLKTATPAAPAPSAVQKRAQPVSVPTMGSEGTDDKKATGARGKELKLPPSTVGRGPSSKASIPSTAITDDSSADDKSSVSSKTESLGSVPIIAAVAPSWGGGKTFADVLKKKEQAAPSTQKK